LEKTSAIISVTIILIVLFPAQLVNAYDNSQYGFAITGPPEWEATYATQAYGYIVSFGTTSRVMSGMHYSVGIAVIVEDTSATLTDYVSAAKTTLAAKREYQLVSEGEINVGELRGYEVVSTYKEYSMEKSKRAYFVENGKAYIIRCRVYADDYDSYLSTFDQTVQTFRIIPISGFPVWSSVVIISITAGIAVAVLRAILTRRKERTSI
jgi:hypothetical protein